MNSIGSMNYPCGVAFGRNGLWAIVDWSNHCVYIFDDKDELGSLAAMAAIMANSVILMELHLIVTITCT